MVSHFINKKTTFTSGQRWGHGQKEGNSYVMASQKLKTEMRGQYDSAQ